MHPAKDGNKFTQLHGIFLFYSVLSGIGQRDKNIKLDIYLKAISLICNLF